MEDKKRVWAWVRRAALDVWIGCMQAKKEWKFWNLFITN